YPVDDDRLRAARLRHRERAEAEAARPLHDHLLPRRQPRLVEREQELRQRAVRAGRRGIRDLVRHAVEVLVGMDVIMRPEGPMKMRRGIGRLGPVAIAVDAQVEPPGLTRRTLPAGNEIRADDPVSGAERGANRKSTRLNSSHLVISYAVFCLKKKKKTE